MEKNIISKAILVAFFVGVTTLANAALKAPPPTNLDYEEHLVSVYQALIDQKNKVIGFEIKDESVTNKEKEEIAKIHTNDLEIVKKIKKATEHKKLILKNIIYQPDWSVYEKDRKMDFAEGEFRITWADKENNMIVKALYATEVDKEQKTLTPKRELPVVPSKQDFSLGRGYYADKNKIDNIKVMFRENANQPYTYFEIDNMFFNSRMRANSYGQASENSTPIIKDNVPTYMFKKLGYQHCQNCHDLSSNPKTGYDGPFFPRYQYHQNLAKTFPELFLEKSQLQKQKMADSKNLGLPKMSDDFYHYVLSVDKDDELLNGQLNSKDKEYENMLKILTANPDIVQNLALDYNSNFCLTINKEEAKIKNQYICADINKKEIHSKIQPNENFNPKKVTKRKKNLIKKGMIDGRQS